MCQVWKTKASDASDWKPKLVRLWKPNIVRLGQDGLTGSWFRGRSGQRQVGQVAQGN